MYNLVDNSVDNFNQHKNLYYNINNLSSPLIKKISDNMVPMWLMRQAGRYLPEFQQIRKNFPDFFELCFTPSAATEVTIQPISRFGFDAAIIFSDILVIPKALGQEIKFAKGLGPVIEDYAPENIKPVIQAIEDLSPVYQAIKQTRETLPKEKSLIGFAGGVWTLIYYMLGGKRDKAEIKVRSLVYNAHKFITDLKNTLTEAVKLHLEQQIIAGCDTVQIFDSWSDALPYTLWQEYIIDPTQEIVRYIKSKYPHIMIIGFPRGAGVRMESYINTGVDVIGCDWQTSPQWIASNIANKIMVQGNLDPAILLTNEVTLAQHLDLIHANFSGKPFIFNLGHGIDQHTPLEMVYELVEKVRNWSW